MQAPKNGQNLNRYSYVLNNPLSYTDPSGYFLKRLFKKWGRVLIAAVVSVVTYGAATGWAAAWLADTALAGNAVAIGAIGGAISGFVGGAILTGSLRGALWGAISGAAFGGIGASNWDQLAKAGSAGLGGGVLSELQGGKFGHGFISAGIGALGIGGGKISWEGFFKSTITAGVVSEVTGGKFGNGAVTAAMSYAISAGSTLLNRKQISVTAKGSKSLSLDSVPEGEVFGSVDSDFRALELLDGIPEGLGVESGFAVLNNGELIKPISCFEAGCTFEVPMDQVDFVVHTHVPSQRRGSLGRRESLARELPGPGDHGFPVKANAPNYYRTPQGNIRVLEYYDSSWYVRTLRGKVLSNPSNWNPRDSK